MFVTPAATVTAKPTCGFSAAMKKLRNMFCTMNRGNATSRMRPYRRPCSKRPPWAPRRSSTGSSAAAPTAIKTAPATAAAIVMNENRRFARSASPSPIVFATRAAPPVPSMNPTEPSAMASGNTRFTTASASLPAKFDTNRPSTTL